MQASLSPASSRASLQACSRFLDIRRSIDADADPFERAMGRAMLLRRASVTLVSDAGSMPLVDTDGQMSFDFR